jgi:hypothetical protein
MIRLYKHTRNTDVAFEIIKRIYIKEKDLYKMKVCWWNVGMCHEPWNMNVIQNISIPRSTFYSDWQLVGEGRYL